VDGDPSAGAGLPASGIRASVLNGIELKHAIRGRVRLQIRAIKGEPALCREVEKQLAPLKVIRHVEVNPVTGSVLVMYDPADAVAIAEVGRMMIPGLDLVGMSSSDGGADADGSLADAVANFVRHTNEKVGAATGDVDLRFLVPVSLFFGGIVRLIASKKLITPAWYDFLWFAFGTYFTLNRGVAPEEPAPTSPADQPEPELVHPNGVQS
jgi:hypothetical protein